jgi:hypothetical protein
MVPILSVAVMLGLEEVPYLTFLPAVAAGSFQGHTAAARVQCSSCCGVLWREETSVINGNGAGPAHAKCAYCKHVCEAGNTTYMVCMQPSRQATPSKQKLGGDAGPDKGSIAGRVLLSMCSIAAQQGW